MEEDKNLSQQEENGVRQEGRALPEEDKPVNPLAAAKRELV